MQHYTNNYMHCIVMWISEWFYSHAGLRICSLRESRRPDTTLHSMHVNSNVKMKNKLSTIGVRPEFHFSVSVGWNHAERSCKEARLAYWSKHAEASSTLRRNREFRCRNKKLIVCRFIRCALRCPVIRHTRTTKRKEQEKHRKRKKQFKWL